MRILVDGDACPKPIKQVIFRTAKREQIETIVVANSFLQLPLSPLIRLVVVTAGLDEADKYIVEQVLENDLVITNDLPLADLVVAKGAWALSSYGKLFTTGNIKEVVAIRNLMAQLRDEQKINGGPPPFSSLQLQNFTNQLQQLIVKARN
ncbi:MAG: YaiI/YqxD family protein [Neisseriales bacterium]|nr:MAG: YaiI/YqxD family protein [Neisseriales bacterium]